MIYLIKKKIIKILKMKVKYVSNVKKKYLKKIFVNVKNVKIFFI